MTRPANASPVPAVQVRALLAKWRQSLELHVKYAGLDDARYRHVQPWPKHERPERWIIDLARERLEVLARLVEQRAAAGDRAFVEAVEIMSFLSSLVGAQSSERFIPLADPQGERRVVLTAGSRGEVARAALQPEARRAGARNGSSSNRPPRNAMARASAAARRTGPSPDGIVFEDAVRFLGWGRKWHELPELISRLSDRPPIADVRRILSERQGQIQKAHGAPID
jgi:hypothetical protein